MNMFLSESSLLIRSLGWTLLHSLWQGALVALCLWIVLKTVANAAARVKYHLSFASLLLIVGWFVVTWIQQWQRLRLLTVVVTEAGREVGVQRTYTLNALPQQGPTELWIERWFPDMDLAFPWIVGFYLVGMCFMLVRFSVGFGKLWQLRRKGISEPEPALAAWVTQLKDKLEIAGSVRLALSSRITMPMMLGFIKPIILLPLSMTTTLSAAELESILLHELAHIKRRDFLVNIFQIIIETVLFFNPFMWWISAGIRREREHCCDDLVVSHTLQPLPYAKALAALEANRFASEPLVMAAAGKKHHLFHRIKRITEMKKTQLNYGRLVAALLMVGLLTFSLVWFTPGFAQTNKNKKKADTGTEKVHHITYVDGKGVRHEYDTDNMPPEVKAKMEEIFGNLPVTHYTSKGGPNDTARTKAIISSTTEEMVADNSGDEDQEPNQETIYWKGTDTEELREKLQESTLTEADWADIGRQLADVDKQVATANKQMKEAMASVDWKKINKQMNEAEREMRKAQAQMKKDMKNVDMNEMRRQMDEARKQMKEARKQMEAARQELSESSNSYGLKVPGYKPRKPISVGKAYRMDSEEAIEMLKDAGVMGAMPAMPAMAPYKPGSPVTVPGCAPMPASPAATEPAIVWGAGSPVSVYVDGKPDYHARYIRNGNAITVYPKGTPMPAPGVKETTTTNTRTSRTAIITSINGVKQLDQMLDKMEEDGLIEKNGRFSISKKDGQLFINGKKQSASVLAKYGGHFEVDHATLSGSHNSMSLSD